MRRTVYMYGLGDCLNSGCMIVRVECLYLMVSPIPLYTFCIVIPETSLEMTSKPLMIANGESNDVIQQRATVNHVTLGAVGPALVRARIELVASA